jgi:phage antirepressor YoqD-like protein
VITIDNITIKTDSEGRYCLNDLHKAAGGERRYDPREFFNRGSTQDLICAIEEQVEMTEKSVNTLRGRNGGTYVCKELVYAYAMWISPAFHLKVIRAYDRLATQGVAVHESAAADVLKNPLKYLRSVIDQAELLQEQLKIAAPKAAVYDEVVAQKSMSLAAFGRTLEGLNTQQLKSDLMRIGSFYRAHAGRYRVYAKYRAVLFAEKVLETYGVFETVPLDKGKERITDHYLNGDLTMKKGFTPN